MTEGPCQINSRPVVVLRNTFNVDARYDITDTLRKCSYLGSGFVVSARDTRSNLTLVIKKLDHILDNPRSLRRTLHTLKLLRHLSHENILTPISIQLPISQAHFSELYLFTDLMGTNLDALIRYSDSLTDDHYKYFMYQILRGVKYIHSANVVHGDLKPRKLLVNDNYDLKISGFGNAQIGVKERYMRSETQTRRYMAPEAILGSTKLDKALDMWRSS